MEAIQRDELLQSIGIQPFYFSDEAKDKMLAVIAKEDRWISEMTYTERSFLRERVLTALQKS